MLSRFIISFGLLGLLLLVPTFAVPENEDNIFMDTVAIEEGELVDSVTPFKAIFFPRAKSSACRFCAPPCSGMFCCDGKWPRCCVNGGRCRCCG